MIALLLSFAIAQAAPPAPQTPTPPMTLPASTDPGEAQLAELRRDFHLLGPVEVARRLEPLALAHPVGAERPTDSAGLARLWLGDLCLARNATAEARHWYELALQHAVQPAEQGRAHRGLADAALIEGNPHRALRELELALASHPPDTMRLELEDKQITARQAERLELGDVVAWGVLGAFLVAALAQLRRARGTVTIKVPVEIWFLLPVYLLFFVVAMGRGEALARAVIETVLGGFLVISLAAVVPLARRTVPQLMQLTGTVVANLAVIYLAIRHAQLMDRLLQSG